MAYYGWSGGANLPGFAGGGGLSQFNSFGAAQPQQQQSPIFNIQAPAQQAARPAPYRQFASSTIAAPSVAPTVGTVGGSSVSAPGGVSYQGVSAPSVSFSAGGPMGGPNIAAGPIWDPQQINAQVAGMKAGNTIGTQTQEKAMRRNMAAKGFGANSPLAMALAAQGGVANRAMNTSGERDMRWKAAEGNAEHILSAQGLQENQAGRKDSSEVARKELDLRALLGNQQAGLQAGITNTNASLSASQSNAANTLAASRDNAANSLAASDANAKIQLALGLAQAQPQQVESNNAFLAQNQQNPLASALGRQVGLRPGQRILFQGNG